VAGRPEQSPDTSDPDWQGVLRCQQTLQQLSPREEGLYSDAASLLFPVHEGLVFMGFPDDDREFALRVISEESAHQTSPEHVERDLEFLRSSSALVVDLLNYLIDRGQIATGSRGVEIGAGSGWPGWLFAEAGCEMYLCELDPNSLASGLVFEHPRIGPMHRIVCDARLLPFADGAFDFVLCKDFSHHIRDKASLFSEVNRILRPGGLLILIDPVRYVLGLRERDDHFGHAITWAAGYLHALEAASFDTSLHTNYHWYGGNRSALTRWLRRRTRDALVAGSMPKDPLTWTVMNTMGGTLIVVARKKADAPRVPRPAVATVDPELLTWTSRGYDRSPFAEELVRIASGIHQTASPA
jgi:SAM-dependent methyltransferase